MSETPRCASLPGEFLEPLAFASPAVGVAQETALDAALVAAKDLLAATL